MSVQAPISYCSPRARFGLIMYVSTSCIPLIDTDERRRPATNTVVEAEFNRMLVPGVSWHSGRIEIVNPNLSTDEAMIAFLEGLRVTIEAAVKSVLHCLPSYLVMGTTPKTGQHRFEISLTQHLASHRNERRDLLGRQRRCSGIRAIHA